MTQSATARAKIPTKSPQLASARATRSAARAKQGDPARSQVLAAGTGRAATRGGGEVIELEYGITVYPARSEGGRWRATLFDDGVQPSGREPVSQLAGHGAARGVLRKRRKPRSRDYRSY